MSQEDLEKLEKRIDDLILVCRRLQSENRALRSREDNLVEANSRLNERTQMARQRIETMIGRLKALERN